MKYELKHDKLATTVFARASAEAKARRRAQEVYRLYEEIGEKRLLTAEELDTLGQYFPVLPPTPTLRALVDRSREKLREEEEAERRRLVQQVEEKQALLDQAVAAREEAEGQRRRALKFLTGVGVLLLLVLMGVGYIWWDARRQLLDKADQRYADREYAEAIDLWQEAQAFPFFHAGLADKVERARVDSALYDQYQSWKQQAEDRYREGDYRLAIATYERMDSLVNNSDLSIIEDLEKRINETNDILDFTYEVYTRKAEIFYAAGREACPQACYYLTRALRLIPDDKNLIEKFESCDCNG